MRKIIIFVVLIAMIAVLPMVAFAAENEVAPADNYDSLKISDEVMDQICGNAFQKVIKIYNVELFGNFSEAHSIDELWHKSNFVLFEFYALQSDEGVILYRELVDNSYVNLIDKHKSRQAKKIKVFFDNAGAAKLSAMFSDIAVYNTYFLSAEYIDEGTAIYYKTNKGDFVYYQFSEIGNSEYLFPIQDFCKFQQVILKECIEYSQTGMCGWPDLSGLWNLSKYDMNSDSFAPLSNTGIEAASEGDLTFELNEDGNGYSVVDCSLSASGDLIIPATYEGKPITCIGNYAFQDCDSLTSITIPDSVTEIGLGAFSGKCPAKIQVDEKNPNYCNDKNGVLFSKDKKELVIVPGAAESYTVPKGVTRIGDGAFYNCESLTSVTIPKGVTSIGDDAFFRCKSLTSVTIPKGVTSIGGHAFSYCEGLTTVTIPKKVTSIGESAFSFCDNLTSVTIPNSVTEIGGHAFSYCDSLTSVTIPNSITEIRQGAFFDCESLTSVTIPNSVTKIGDHAFYSCKNLKNVYYGGDETQFAEIEIERGNDYLINAKIVYNYTTPGSPLVLIVIISAAALALTATATAVILIRKKKKQDRGSAL